MVSQRRRILVWSGLALVAIWSLAMATYFIAKNAKVTAEKVQAFAMTLDLSKLTPAQRAEAIQKLADKINALSPEERRRWRVGRSTRPWFDQMTEKEKGVFLEKILPSGFKQMLASFEEMPEDRRRRIVGEALKRLSEAREEVASEEKTEGGRLGEGDRPDLSPELEEKMRTIGLKTFYSQSSAQTKAELAPLLEELQRVMASGRRFRNR